MKTTAAFALGAALTAIILPITSIVYEQVTHLETVHVEVEVEVPAPHDYERLLQVLRQPEPSQVDDDTDRECVLAIHRLTSDPIAGVALYIAKYYKGDACSAYMHQVTHGFY